jgi:hypothetical protein
MFGRSEELGGVELFANAAEDSTTPRLRAAAIAPAVTADFMVGTPCLHGCAIGVAHDQTLLNF